MDLTENEKKAQEIILGEIEKGVDLLFRFCEKYCNEVAPAMYGGDKATSVPLYYIKQGVDRLKKDMREGAGLHDKAPISPSTISDPMPGTQIRH